MAEYIDREKAIEIIKLNMAKVVSIANIGTTASNVYNLAIDHAIDYLSVIPPADVQEVKRVKKIPMEMLHDKFKCPECGNKDIVYTDKYCSECGAKFEDADNVRKE